MAYCGRCGHPEKAHCKGDRDHEHYPGYLRKELSVQIIHCTKRHCLEPLCSCIELTSSGSPSPLP